MRFGLVAVVLSLVMAGGGIASASTSGTLADSTGACPSGATAVSPSTTEALADGGHSYHYDLNGTSSTLRVPPSSLSLVSASATQLSYYNLPPRPDATSGSSALGYSLTDWLNFINKITWPSNMCSWDGLRSAAATSQPVGQPSPGSSAGNRTFLNWSGIVNNSNTYDQAQGTITEPSTSTYPCNQPSSAAYWVGMGGYYSGNLVQDGSISLPNGDYLWYEYLGAGGTINLTTVPGAVNPGDKIYMKIVQGGATTGFTVSDMTTGTFLGMNSNVPADYDGSSAEHIAERITENGNLTDLQRWNPGSVVWTSSNSHIAYGNDIFLNGPYDSVNMVDNGGSLLASMGAPIQADSIKDTWVRCN